MGTWGPAILSNDLGSDIKDQWKELLGEGWDPEELSKAFIESAKEEGILEDMDEAYEFWICLALVQWKTGRLQSDVKNKAIEMLSDQNIEKVEKEREWDKADFEKRMEHLQQLKVTLNSAQPPARKIKKPYRQDTALEKGDIITIQLKSGKYIGLEIIEIEEKDKERVPIAVLYTYLSDKMPTANSILESDLMTFKYHGMGFTNSNFQLSSLSKKQNEPIDRIIILQRGREPSIKKHMPCSLCFWDEIDELLEIWIKIFNRNGKD